MPNDWPLAVAFVLAIIGAFVAAILVGLRWGDQSQKRALQDTNAENVWAQSPRGDWIRSNLLYGIWQSSMMDVVMIVRDCSDRAVGSITKDVNGTTLRVGEEIYRIVPQSTWLESAKLVHLNANTLSLSKPICLFEVKGWIWNRVAKYTIDGFGIIEIAIRYGWPRKSHVVPIQKAGNNIGQLFTVGGASRNMGRALLLPGEIPLPVRLFILIKWAGSPLKTKSL
jgi:hypothetical protein